MNGSHMQARLTQCSQAKFAGKKSRNPRTRHSARTLAACATSVVFSFFTAMMAGTVFAQAVYPVKPVRVFVPNPPGGATDTLARVVGPRLAEGLGQPFLVENRSGSNGNLATETTAKSAPDGYSLLLGADAQVVISPHLYAMGIDTLRDLTPVSSLVSTHMVLAVNASLPVTSLGEFIEYARRAKPALAYASIGNGSQHHLAMEMLKTRAQLEMVHIPYKGGGPATVALLANEVAVMFGGNSVSGQIKAGKLRALALGGKRTANYPGVPSLAEPYPGLEVIPWLGMFAPSGVPAPALARLRAEIAKLLADPGIREKLQSMGGLDPFVTTPEEFDRFYRAEHAKYGQVVKALGVKVD